MQLEMIQGPGGPQRCEDGGGHLVRIGEAVTLGQVLVADYANGSTLAGATSPNLGTSAESVYMVLDTGNLGYAKQLNSLVCVAKEAGSAGDYIRVTFQGYAKIDVGTTIAASHAEIGIDPTTAGVEAGVATDIIIGRTLGAALTAGTPGLCWFDGINKYVKA